MKKVLNRIINLLCIVIMLFPMFITPSYKVAASSTYTVVMVANSTNNKTIGTYSTYSEAVKVMNAQNSTSTSVASIYKDGVIINSRYAIFQFNASTGTVNLYQNASDSVAYTYTSPSSMTDAAFIDSDGSKAQIMLNGFKGWVDLSKGTIIPISLLGSNAVNITASGLNLRASASTSSTSLAAITCTNSVFTYTEKTTSGGYTWYKISYNGVTGWVASGSWLTETTGTELDTYYYKYSSGNLLHRYAYHTGTTYSDYFTNLGPAPDYMTTGTHYYSFDGGIYLYSTLTAMLDDYRNDTYTNSINASNPNYPYYLYLPSRSTSNVTASQLDSQITNTSSKLYGQGKYFKEAESLYGMNALSAFSTAKNESSSGTSTIAINKNNVFGYGASDSCPYDCAYSYASVRDSIMDYAKNGNSKYMTAGASYYFGTHAGTKGSGRNVKYASDPLWGEKQASNAYTTDKNLGLIDYNSNTIAVSKYGKYNLPVYKDTTSNEVIYYMRNSNSNFKVYNIPVTALEKVGDYYKIYADSSDYVYGYVKASDFNVTNNAPIISASNKEISLNSTFDYLSGVSASDSEDGNLTSKITYSGTVDTSKSGAYEVTYSVTDGNNFTTSQSVTITVKGASEPTIDASDKEITQYTTFDYMEGVSASDDIDGDLTDSISYEGDVNTSKVGEYSVTYTVTNSNGKTSTKEIIISVVKDEDPEISASDVTVYLNHDYDPYDGVSASDKEDGDLTDSIEVTENNVDTSVIGQYSVTYSITDSAGQSSSKTITVSVEAKTLEEVDGWFHLEKLSFEDDYLEISGFNILKGVDNGIDDNITHTLILEEQNTGEQISFELDRWLDSVPYVANDGTSTDYSGSWFTGKISLSDIPAGDYTIYIKTESDDYYVKKIVSNLEYTDIDRKYEDSNERGYLVKENLILATTNLELFVRDDGLISYESAPTLKGLLSYFFSYNFDGNSLNLMGSSYTLKTDYSESANVEREIILEDKYTHEIVYRKSIGSITTGPYKITSNTNQDMTRAWFDASIDLSALESGTYVIYLKTSSGDIEDYGELVDYSYGDLSDTTTINGKNVSLTRNSSQRLRMELVIE